MGRTILKVVVGACVGLVGMTSGEAQADTRGAAGGALERDGLFGGFSFGRGSIEVNCGDCATGGEQLNAALREAFSLEAHMGYMLTPRLALVGEHWTVRYSARGGALFDDTTRHLVAQHITSLGAQVYLTDSIWLRTGLGVGWHVSDGEYAKRRAPSAQTQAVTTNGEGVQEQRPAVPPLEADSQPGASYFAAIGWELAHSSSFVAEVQLRAASTQRADDAYEVRNIGLNVGASWY